MNIKSFPVFFLSFTASLANLVTTTNFTTLFVPKSRRVESHIRSPRAFLPKIVVDVFPTIPFKKASTATKLTCNVLNWFPANFTRFSWVCVRFTPSLTSALFRAKLLLFGCMGFTTKLLFAPLACVPINLVFPVARARTIFCYFPFSLGGKFTLVENAIAKCAPFFELIHVDTFLSKKSRFFILQGIKRTERLSETWLNSILGSCRIQNIRALDKTNYNMFGLLAQRISL